MKTDDLIDLLSREATHVPPGEVAGRVVRAVAVGGLVTLAVYLVAVPREIGFGELVVQRYFWMKVGYSASIALVGLVAAVRLGRPSLATGRLPAWLAVPSLAIALVGLAELAALPPGERLAAWLGGSWSGCPLYILALSLPISAVALAGVRAAAPTDLRRYGFACGLVAGAVSALVYAFNCPEASMAFLATWYTLGILLAATLNALLAPLTLRW